MLRDDWREPLRAQRDPLGPGAGRVGPNRDRPRQWRKQTWLGRFVSTYGWRAYALPVLVAADRGGALPDRDRDERVRADAPGTRSRDRRRSGRWAR